MISPTTIRIETCSICQLRCPLCSNISPESIVGKGKLKLEDFKRLIDDNPHIRKVELGSKGEVFLNNELAEIIRYAYEKNVMTSFGPGANLNEASDEALEALVKYQTYRLRVSIDGATQETYRKYRIGGDLRQVIRNIHKINALKDKYHSDRPDLVYQFIVFGHNEHEMGQALTLARMLKMNIRFKLNRVPETFPVKNQELVKRHIGYFDRDDYFQQEGREYVRQTCFQLWKSPQVNWDGKLLGCSGNTWAIFADNVFTDGLMRCVNNEKMEYAREMLKGRASLDHSVPCARCSLYESLERHGNWLTDTEIQNSIQRTPRWLKSG